MYAVIFFQPCMEWIQFKKYHFRIAVSLEVIKLCWRAYNFLTVIEFFKPINISFVNILNINWLVIHWKHWLVLIGFYWKVDGFLYNSVLINNIKWKTKTQKIIYWKFQIANCYCNTSSTKNEIRALCYAQMKGHCLKIVQSKIEVLTPIGYLAISISFNF